MRTTAVLCFVCVLSLTSSVWAQGASPLDQAAATAAKGHTGEAMQIYRQVLQQEPQNVRALSALSELLQAEGKWREAIPVLELLVKLEPQNSKALYQLGRMRSWQTGGRTESLDLLHRACDASNHDPEPCAAYAEVLSWGEQTRMEAVLRLQDVLAVHPESTSVRIQLAQILSWSDATRPRGLGLFEQGLKIDPGNVELLLASAEVLSWRSVTRPEAMKRYQHVLELNPEEPRALTGKAQLLAWQNRSDEALQLYRRVLAKDPQNAAALRGEAEIMNWKGHFVQARDLAQQAHRGAPSDSQASLELARAYVGLQRFLQARQVLANVEGNPSPDFADVRHQIQRGLGTYVEFGYAFRQSPISAANNNIEFHRFSAAISTPVGAGSRLTLIGQPTLYNNFQRGFNSNYFGAALDSSISDRVNTHLQLGAEQFQNVPVNVDGDFGLNFKPVASTTLRLNFQRQPVEESLLSTQGQNFGGVFFGQVFSNLADVGISYNNALHKLDFALDYTDGAYAGRNLDTNRRYSVEGQMGRSLHGDQPYVRLGYYVNYTSFDHDADIQAGQPLSPLTGGYFSPTRYLLNQGVLSISHRFSKNVLWGLSGAAGGQNVETNSSSFANAQFASSFETHLFWRITPMNEAKFAYSYLNVFNAFERNLFTFSWRHYF
jgi:tetratricopeptide (TPR) repeat protein